MWFRCSVFLYKRSASCYSTLNNLVLKIIRASKNVAPGALNKHLCGSAVLYSQNASPNKTYTPI